VRSSLGIGMWSSVCSMVLVMLLATNLRDCQLLEQTRAAVMPRHAAEPTRAPAVAPITAPGRPTTYLRRKLRSTLPSSSTGGT
ncbi:hypothetical protein ACR9PT_14980, partial [Piscirickettsia salmonis]|uniref:hypothetical protein n=1 Tax=Piscirickettsia salmonis TaxID=1238 RepID=UPI003EBF16C0